MRGLRFRGLWLVPIILGIACRVSACPVCGVGRDGTASVYLMTAVLMSTVPLVMGGVMAYYLIRRAKRDRHQQHERAPRHLLCIARWWASTTKPPHRGL
jgi:hypothetical protein